MQRNLVINCYQGDALQTGRCACMQVPPIGRMDGTGRATGRLRRHRAFVRRSPSPAQRCRTLTVRTPIMVEDVVAPQPGLKAYPSDADVFAEPAAAPARHLHPLVSIDLSAVDS